MNNYLTQTTILNQNKKSILITKFLLEKYFCNRKKRILSKQNHFKKTNIVKVKEKLLRKKSLWNISYKHYKVRVLDLFFRLDKYSDSISETLCNILEHLCPFMKLHVTSDSLKNNVSFMLVYKQIRLLLWYLT